MDPKRARQASLLALLQQHQGGVLTRQEIVARVDGYSDNDEAARKMLRRDLEDLEKSCDLVADYVKDWRGEGYRIRRRPLALSLTGRDLAVLAFVARTLGAEERDLLHLEALGAVVDRAPGGLLAPLEEHRALPLLIDAIDAHREVSFAYAKPGDPTPMPRRVQPWRLLHRGGWYLIGFDLTRNAKRSFKLTRIVEGPELGSPAVYEIPDAIAEIAEPWASGDATARLAVDPGQARAVARRLGGTIVDHDDGKRPVVEAEFGDEAAFASFLAGYGPDLEVLAPASLRDAVRMRFDAIIAATEAR